jgi:hypothetical protein
VRPDRLRECLDALDWRTANLAAMAGVSPVTARRWQSGRLPVPAQVGAAIEAMAKAAVLLSAKQPATPGHHPRWNRDHG